MRSSTLLQLESMKRMARHMIDENSSLERLVDALEHRVQEIPRHLEPIYQLYKVNIIHLNLPEEREDYLIGQTRLIRACLRDSLDSLEVIIELAKNKIKT